MAEQAGIRAVRKYVRMSPWRIRRVVNLVRGKPVPWALAVLRHLPQKKAAREVFKAVQSAVANAEDRYGLSPDELKIVHIVADEGPRLKRWRPRARGRVDMYVHRTTHITVVVAPTEELGE